ncbi:MAG: PEP-CTERM sorting domain-containing protein [Planctomycetaceae bacterium]|jgi:hypothetical protein|nr:PEP-CTERM sorting domain-containing protein [Planctomycetaceae bacterium]
MKLFRTLAIAVLAMVSGASAQAGVVLSNMGASGLENTGGTTNTDLGIGTGLERLAGGFTTGGSAFTLNWASAVVFGANSGTIAKTASIYSDASGSPGTLVGTSSTTLVGNKDAYKFNFSGVTLQASTKYWLVPEDGLSWYLHTSLTNPSDLAASGAGFTHAGFVTTTNGTTWSDKAPLVYTYAISGTTIPAAVPEPALTSLLCLGGVALIRRRMKK